jgi:hypothetical protein
LLVIAYPEPGGQVTSKEKCLLQLKKLTKQTFSKKLDQMLKDAKS